MNLSAKTPGTVTNTSVSLRMLKAGSSLILQGRLVPTAQRMGAVLRWLILTTMAGWTW
jgi:hypothetical protein